jgi:hypothetical protein
MSAKKPKKLFGKTFNKFKKKESPTKSQTPAVATANEILEVEPTERFSTSLVRMSLNSTEDIDAYSFDGVSDGDSNNDDGSKEGSIFTDEEEEEEPKERWNQRDTPINPREVAVGNKPPGDGDDSSSDDDDMYLEESEEKEEKPVKEDFKWAPPEEGDDSDDLVERTDSLMALPSTGAEVVPEETASILPSHAPPTRGVLTQSIIDYTTPTGSSLDASVDEIDDAPMQGATRDINFTSDDRKTSMEPTMEAFEEGEGSDKESEEESNDANAAENLKEEAEGDSIDAIKTTEDEGEENNEERIVDLNDIKAVDENEALDGSPRAASALQTTASVAYSSDGEEDSTEYNFVTTPEPTAVDEQASTAEIDSLLARGDALTSEDEVKLKKLRGSMVWAKRMSSRGDAVREDPSYEVGEVELEDDVTKDEQEFTGVHDDLRKSSQLADMQLAEVTELRARLQEQQEQIEGLEHERDFNASKVGELMAVMSMSNKGDDLKELGEHLANKSVEVAELNYELNYLKDRLAKAEDKSNTLEAERDANKVVIANLSESLWNDSSPKKAASTEEDAAHDLIKQGGVIPTDDAMVMTIAKLQNKIEALEEEKTEFMATVTTLTASVAELTQENEARMLKIAALESQFLSLNQRQVASSVTTPDRSPKGSPEKRQEGEKLSGFKAWASVKMHKAQEQYETIKDDFESRRSNTNPDQILTDI